MERFDTAVQDIKNKALCEIVREAWAGTLTENILSIPSRVLPNKTATMRCCVYKERAIFGARLNVAIGGHRYDPNVIEVIDIACDDCPAAGYVVTESCRGCLAHRCQMACKANAIRFREDRSAVIDKNKCRECGACAKVCPFGAILNRKRPCINACKINAISVKPENNAALINEAVCIRCGACVYQCPFGAITDKGQLLKVVDLFKSGRKAVALLAPAAAGQLMGLPYGKLIAGLHRLGFSQVYETAAGADLTAAAEARELSEKGFLISSCCPAFVRYVREQFPSLAGYISATPSPMAMLAGEIRKREPDTAVVFIGPCTAKKDEIRRPEVAALVDAVLTFEELAAFFDAREIDLAALPEEKPVCGSKYGRAFGRTGGLSQAVAEALAEQGIEFDLRPQICDGIGACRAILTLAEKGRFQGNFIEGMACEGGCAQGAGCLRHSEKNGAAVESYAAAATKETIL